MTLEEQVELQRQCIIDLANTCKILANRMAEHEDIFNLISKQLDNHSEGIENLFRHLSDTVKTTKDVLDLFPKN